MHGATIKMIPKELLPIYVL